MHIFYKQNNYWLTVWRYMYVPEFYGTHLQVARIILGATPDAPPEPLFDKLGWLIVF